MSSFLPVYYKNGKVVRGVNQRNVKVRELRCLPLLFLTFVFAWLTIMSYMPSIQNNYVTFEGSYSKFSPGSEDSRDWLDNMFGNPRDSDEESVKSVAKGKTALYDHMHSVSPREETNPSTVILVSSNKNNVDITSPSSKKIGDDNSQETVNSIARGDDRIPSVVVKTESTPATENATIGINNMNTTEEKRNKIKEMIKHAWDGYRKFAFGANELKPISKNGHSAGVFGKTKMGATLVDSLDTLYIAGLKDEFEEAKKWVTEEFHIDQGSTDVSAFEFNIRFVGGFLSAYALSGDKIFMEKAKSVADKLLPVFNTPTGIPRSLLNLQSGSSKNFKWAAGGGSILSEVGSYHLEFQYLTEITRDPSYLDKVLKIRRKLREMSKNGIYSNYINCDKGVFSQRFVGIGALGDSFYEYLLKSWLITSKKDTEALEMFTETVHAMDSIIFQKRNNDLYLVTDQKNGRSDGKMQHLACFSGGMFALASQHIKENSNKSKHYYDLAQGITGTCHESYIKSPTHIGPEMFRFDSAGSVIGIQKSYFLRPETVESYFYMWRLTHDQKYREWGWETVQALETHCRVDNGYSGLKDVTRSPPPKDDTQQSFFIAETLKYLYLLFSDDSVISLDDWVFNTEAHPLPVLSNVPDYPPLPVVTSS